MQLKQAKIIVFARAPLKGQVKTRLASSIGDDRALDIYLELLDSVLHEISGCDFPVCCYSDFPDHGYFDFWKEKDIEIKLQTGADLGERMFNALGAETGEQAAVVLIGSDCPYLSCEVIHQVFTDLENGRQVVIVPSVDGGYVLIAFAEKIHAQLFEGIDWSTDRVMQQTEAKLNELGLSHSLLEPSSDIDTFDDYKTWLGVGQ